jgi:PleD family two-component response regulator
MIDQRLLPGLRPLSLALQEAHEQDVQRIPGAQRVLRLLVNRLEHLATFTESATLVLLAEQLREADEARRSNLLAALAALVGQAKGKGRSAILLVDDDADMELLVRAALAPAFRISVATTLVEGHRILADRDFACVVLDLGLPDGDGFQLLESLQSPNGGTLLPCLMLTAAAEPSRMSEAMALGADTFMVKPVSAEQIGIKVGEAIRRHHAERPTQLLRRSAS